MGKLKAIALSLLKEELKHYEISNYIPELIKHQAVLIELGYALSPAIHEGKLRPYGFIVINSPDSPINKSIPQQPRFSLTEARMVADGCHCFSIFKEGKFRGVLPLEKSVENELQLVQFQQELKAIICTTDANGVTKIFCEEGILIHQYRRWQRKPSIKRELEIICQCVPQVNHQILKNILQFCFHDLSPRKIGSTIVWCLRDITPEEMENMRHQFDIREKIEAKIGETVQTAILRHILTHTDGAAIISPEGIIVGVGAQLKYSDKSKRIVKGYSGTRHTSAKRFSYDLAKVIVFVVSSDGPVTVYSDGMSIVDLNVHFYDAEIESLPIKEKEIEPASTDRNLSCLVCKKTFKVQETGFVQEHDNFEIFCPVCGNFIGSTRYSDIDIYIVKHLDEIEIKTMPLSQISMTSDTASPATAIPNP